MDKFIRIALCFSLLLTVAPAHKQAATQTAPPASAYKLLSLKVTGTSRYNDKEMLAASGLQIGRNAVDGDFKEAVQRLGNSGMFSDVSYAYSSSTMGTKLEIQVVDTDSSKLVPVQFENFVWFTDAQLLSALQTRVPLFKNLLPLAGDLPDHVSEALQAMLSERQLPGHVSYLREAPNDMAVALTAIDYRVEDVTMRIRDVEFPGASPEQVPWLTAAARRLSGAPYGRPTLAAAAQFDLLPVYLQRGYLRAAFGPSDARIVPHSTSNPDPSDVEVDALVPVTPGRIYSTSGITWKGNAALGTNELVPLLHLLLGRPADAVQLRRDLDSITTLYRSRGYIMVQIKTDSQLDEDRGAVHYDITVAEGDLFKMGELEITGLDTQSAARMQNAWTLHPGQPYDATYPMNFVGKTGQLLPRGVGWGVNIHETPDQKEKTVDVEIHFKQK